MCLSLAFEEIANYTEYISEEKVEIKVLDSIFDTLCSTDEVVFLKLDTQGYEKNILNGSKESLKKIKGIQSNCSNCHIWSIKP